MVMDREHLRKVNSGFGGIRCKVPEGKQKTTGNREGPRTLERSCRWLPGWGACSV